MSSLRQHAKGILLRSPQKMSGSTLNVLSCMFKAQSSSLFLSLTHTHPHTLTHSPAQSDVVSSSCNYHCCHSNQVLWSLDHLKPCLPLGLHPTSQSVMIQIISLVLHATDDQSPISSPTIRSFMPSLNKSET